MPTCFLATTGYCKVSLLFCFVILRFDTSALISPITNFICLSFTIIITITSIFRKKSSDIRTASCNWEQTQYTCKNQTFWQWLYIAIKLILPHTQQFCCPGSSALLWIFPTKIKFLLVYIYFKANGYKCKSYLFKLMIMEMICIFLGCLQTCNFLSMGVYFTS